MEYSDQVKRVQLYLALHNISDFAAFGIDGMLGDETKNAIDVYMGTRHKDFKYDQNYSKAVMFINQEIFPILSPTIGSDTVALAQRVNDKVMSIKPMAEAIFQKAPGSSSLESLARQLLREAGILENVVKEFLPKSKK